MTFAYYTPYSEKSKEYTGALMPLQKNPAYDNVVVER